MSKFTNLMNQNYISWLPYARLFPILENNPLRQKKTFTSFLINVFLNSRDGKIRTCDLLVPNQARWPDYATSRKRMPPNKIGGSFFYNIMWRLPTFPRFIAVSSAERGLTSLFGMGRGEHPPCNHHQVFRFSIKFPRLQSISLDYIGLLSLSDIGRKIRNKYS